MLAAPLSPREPLRPRLTCPEADLCPQTDVWLHRGLTVESAVFHYSPDRGPGKRQHALTQLLRGGPWVTENPIHCQDKGKAAASQRCVLLLCGCGQRGSRCPARRRHRPPGSPKLSPLTATGAVSGGPQRHAGSAERPLCLLCTGTALQHPWAPCILPTGTLAELECHPHQQSEEEAKYTPVHQAPAQ